MDENLNTVTFLGEHGTSFKYLNWNGKQEHKMSLNALRWNPKPERRRQSRNCSNLASDQLHGDQWS